MFNFFRSNLEYLKDKKGETYASIGLQAGCSANTVSYWVHKNNEPKMIEVERIAQYFEIPIQDLLYVEMSNAYLNAKTVADDKGKDAHLIAHADAHLKQKKGSLEMSEPEKGYSINYKEKYIQLLEEVAQERKKSATAYASKEMQQDLINRVVSLQSILIDVAVGVRFADVQDVLSALNKGDARQQKSHEIDSPAAVGR